MKTLQKKVQTVNSQDKNVSYSIMSETLGNSPLMQKKAKRHEDLFNSANNSEVAQLYLYKWKPTNDITTKDEKEANKIAKTISGHVDKAYTELNAGNYDGASDKQKSLYILRLNEYNNGEKTMHPSTAAGYVIEGKVNNKIKGHSQVDLQGTDMMKGTRPDIVINLTSGNYALVDITAQNSLGHIFNKKGNWTNHDNIPYVAEAWYPSIDFSDKKVTKLTKAQIEEASKMAQERKDVAELASKEFFEGRLKAYTEIQNSVGGELNRLDEETIANFTTRQKALFLGLGLEINIDGTFARLNYEDRATKAELDSLVSDENPIPQIGFNQESAMKLINSKM